MVVVVLQDQIEEFVASGAAGFFLVAFFAFSRLVFVYMGFFFGRLSYRLHVASLYTLLFICETMRSMYAALPHNEYHGNGVIGK